MITVVFDNNYEVRRFELGFQYRFINQIRIGDDGWVWSSGYWDTY